MRSHLLCTIAICSVPALVGAQQGGAPAPAPITEPRLPANPQSPTDFQSTVNAPGMPQTTPPPVSPSGTPGLSTGAGGGGGGSPTGYQGGDMTVDDEAGAAYGGPPARQVPATHEVKQGDTLWNICDHYYADPWAWPQVWAYNKQITNPHWIYPGDRVRLLRAPTMSARAAEPPEAMSITGGGGGAVSGPGQVQLRQNGFADPKELAESGSVAGSPAERLMLSQHDEIYLQGNDRWSPQRGKQYTVYKVREDLKDGDGKKVGSIVEILGTVQVRSVNDQKVATAVITESIAPIERNHRVGDLRRRFVRVPVRPAEQNIEGEVIATLREGKHIATDELVFVGRGSNQGVRQGNRFLVVRTGDGYKRLLQDRDDPGTKFPQETVAEVTVIDARPDSSVGLVTRATKEIRVGDKVRMRRGY